MTIPEFFKIFLTDDSEQLDLPKKFVRRHGEAISNTVFLKLPYGQQWEIGLLKSDGKVYLHQGWPKFVKHYRLDYGHLLYFRYEGNSHFGVSIFCLANCRVDYPSIPAQSDGNPTLPRNKETEEDASILQLNSPKHKRMKTCATGKLRKSKGSRGTYKSYQNSRAFEKASSFSSSNPFFIRIVRGYHRACYSMRLPDNFIKGHLERKTQIVKLQVGMQYWHVKLLNCDSGFFFSGGLSTFVNENALGPGDVCIYELINKKPSVLKVSIFKANAV